MQNPSDPPLDQEYWDQLYRRQEAGWDIGYPSPPLKAYIDQLKDRNLKILIPGAGRAYEAEYLWKQGFIHTYVIDLSTIALEDFCARVPGFPASQLIQGDFFEHKGQYDLILEQTFLSAISPALRNAYVEKMHELLKPGGKLAGLLHNDPRYQFQPPLVDDDYRKLFSTCFTIKTLEAAYNSIERRAGNELFIIAERA